MNEKVINFEITEDNGYYHIETETIGYANYSFYYVKKSDLYSAMENIKYSLYYYHGIDVTFTVK